MNKRLTALCILISLSFILTVVTGCNTVQGAGRDIEATGEAIEDAAD